jgi:hypothetical protein
MFPRWRGLDLSLLIGREVMHIEWSGCIGGMGCPAFATCIYEIDSSARDILLE